MGGRKIKEDRKCRFRGQFPIRIKRDLISGNESRCVCVSLVGMIQDGPERGTFGCVVVPALQGHPVKDGTGNGRQRGENCFREFAPTCE